MLVVAGRTKAWTLVVLVKAKETRTRTSAGIVIIIIEVALDKPESAMLLRCCGGPATDVVGKRKGRSA